MIFDGKSKDIICTLAGQYEIIKNHRVKSERTGVIEISAGGRRLFVKIHNRLSHWHPEVHAYKNWTGSIGRLCPEMTAYFNDGEIFGIITTPINGKTVNEAEIEDINILSKIYFDAGAAFKEMQKNYTGEYFGIPQADGSPYNADTVTDPVTYISGAIKGLFKQGHDKGLFDKSHERLLKFCIGNCGVFHNEVPVPTNWDFSPNNWMVDEKGCFNGFIDFENTLWGLSLDSFGVILERYVFDSPELRDSFFAGYGLENDEATELKLIILSFKMAIADVYSGHMYNNKRFHDCGRNMLNSF